MGPRWPGTSPLERVTGEDGNSAPAGKEPQQASRGQGGRVGSRIQGASPLCPAFYWMRVGVPQHAGRLRVGLPLTLSCILGVHGEDSRLVHHSVGEARPIGCDVAAVDVIHIELQGAS